MPAQKAERSSATAVEEPLFAKLDEMKIPFELYRHPAAMTAEDLQLHMQGVEGLPVKNLFLYDKKKRYFVVAAAVHSNTNMKVIAAKLEASNPRFAGADLMKSMLGVSPGAVTPLAAMNDKESKVSIVLDEELKKASKVFVHPLHNEASIAIAPSDLERFVVEHQHEPKWINCEAESQENAAPTGAKKEEKKPAAASSSKEAVTDSSMLGVTVKKEENFPEWYTQVIIRAEMIEYYDISGCYILRPWSFFVWEKIHEFLDTKIKTLGVQNAYFPMFVSKAKLEAEKEHVEGFSPEVAWVTKYGESDLTEPIAIRPTSETIMYPTYAKWIRSHRDLPLKLNQWNTVVRWEFKQPTPFIRTREFLWQEGHTAHASDEEAEEFVYRILDFYRDVYESLLAVPVIRGVKSEEEKFAGGKMTTTVEAFVATNGRGVQAATSHHLGTNFSKMFDIEFEDVEGKRQLVHQTSWGLSTRSLGVMIMVHGDDRGLVMPPRVSPIQVVIIPIFYKDEVKAMLTACEEIEKKLQQKGLRTRLDDRVNYTPGWKYNHWEVKGVPVRLEVGPRDMKNRTARIVRRVDNAKEDLSWDGLEDKVAAMMDSIHDLMFENAKKVRDESIVQIREFKEVMPALNNRKLVLAPWCEDDDSEEAIKKETQRLSQQADQGDSTSALTGAMKTLCIPLEQPPMPEGTKCFFTGKPAKSWTLWGRSY